MAKILICGAKGQLGMDCRLVMEKRHVVLSHDIDTMDITQPMDVDRIIGDFTPDILVNCAAFTQVDACETEVETARSINGKAPGILARAMETSGGRIIHVSTDYVFDGTKTPPEPYVESDAPSPISIYGKTKLEGEAAVKKATERFAIVRTAWLYGAVGHNFLKTMLRLAINSPERTLRVVDDQFGSPTWSFRLAEQIAALVDAGGSGIYHATAEGHGTWYELARYFLEQMKISHHIEPCTTADYPTPAVRPKNAILENSRLKASGIHIMKDWHLEIERFVSRFRGQLLDEVVKGSAS
jgi:dTDP-4-dehydrorhamnose reductase